MNDNEELIEDFREFCEEILMAVKNRSEYHGVKDCMSGVSVEINVSPEYRDVLDQDSVALFYSPGENA